MYARETNSRFLPLAEFLISFIKEVGEGIFILRLIELLSPNLFYIFSSSHQWLVENSVLEGNVAFLFYPLNFCRQQFFQVLFELFIVKPIYLYKIICQRLWRKKYVFYSISFWMERWRFSSLRSNMSFVAFAVYKLYPLLTWMNLSNAFCGCESKSGKYLHHLIVLS